MGCIILPRNPYAPLDMKHIWKNGIINPINIIIYVRDLSVPLHECSGEMMQSV